MPKRTNPLTKADQQQVDSYLRRLNELLPELQKYERCGIDCEDRKQVISEMTERLLAIKREFGNRG